MILYGIPTCDTCKKARKTLEAAGYDVTLRDVRSQPLSEEEWAVLLTEFGSNLGKSTIDHLSEAFRCGCESPRRMHNWLHTLR